MSRSKEIKHMCTKKLIIISNSFSDWRLNKLKNTRTKIKYASIPFVLILIKIQISSPIFTLSGFLDNSSYLILLYILTTLFGMGLLTYIHHATTWKEASNFYKKYVIISSIWILSTIIYTEVLSDHFYNNVVRNLFIAIVSALLLGFCMFLFSCYTDWKNK